MASHEHRRSIGYTELEWSSERCWVNLAWTLACENIFFPRRFKI